METEKGLWFAQELALHEKVLLAYDDDGEGKTHIIYRTGSLVKCVNGRE